ncbi:MAG TPA: cupin domain-containing protein [Noviherbaspirillum sp.]|jgi:mannose-6-phosphate isomerase-like protein (cupin superfamily)|uniref:cupin domain-containing protein n=1 Tax=Noviherbaspirillum sp. TaxID=1926288 RepID=UPI002DDD80FA|nr:cupin domain-containing protein [Noviherbaspirillum sp.]HEV2611897.1 cupin domain-containing protein [Noviherbaspirillum sp.]
MSINPETTYVHLGTDGSATEVEGGERFWSLPPDMINRFAQGWLISEYVFDEDWRNWEMHPHGDEFVYLLSGEAEMLLEEEAGIRNILLRNRGAVLVPKGVWHTARVRTPCRMLHITRGEGTQHRAV